MKTIDITLASPEVAASVEQALRDQAEFYGTGKSALAQTLAKTLLEVASVIQDQRARFDFSAAGDRFFGKVAP